MFFAESRCCWECGKDRSGEWSCEGRVNGVYP